VKNISKAPTKQAMLGKISIGIAIILLLVIGNEFTQVFPTHQTKLQGGLILLPLFVAPIGIALGLISLRKSKNGLAKWSVIFNIILFLFPMLYMTLGTVLFGV
jgi:hypothetical protein